MIEAILFKIIYLLLFGLVVETIIVFALVILVIILSKLTIKKHICNLTVVDVFLHIYSANHVCGSSFPILIILAFYVFVIILGILIMLKYKKLERMS